MRADRPYVISIAGNDPSAGAGLFADLKCFEQLKVYGFGVSSALTVQTDADFISNQWIEPNQIIAQMEPLLNKFEVRACKIGLIENLAVLEQLVHYLNIKRPKIKIVVDPIMKATAGYDFHQRNYPAKSLQPILEQIDLLTPNYDEMLVLGNGEDAIEMAENWSKKCPIMLKGGHNPNAPGTDYFFDEKQCHVIIPKLKKLSAKHGSGCVLSAAITAYLALNVDMLTACRQGKNYIEDFLNSNHSLLGYHNL